MTEPAPATQVNDNAPISPTAVDTPSPTTTTAEEVPKPPTTTTDIEEEAPDPSEDDLDELDGAFPSFSLPTYPFFTSNILTSYLYTDMLDEFSATSISASGPGRPAQAQAHTSASKSALDSSSSKPNTTTTAEDRSLASDAFSAQLQKEMAALLGEIDESPEMRRKLDDLMGELTGAAEKAMEEEDEKEKGGEGGAVGSGSKEKPTAVKSAGPAPGPGSGSGESSQFTDTIRRTMERMAASGEQASAAAQQGGSDTTGGGSEEDMLARLLQDMATGSGGEGSEEEFSKMLMGMMEQLTNKEILYEPMKDLDTKFPEWIGEHEGKIEEGEMQKYKEQQGLVREIVGRFERKGYSDEDAGDREFIVERMQKMQASGSPPADLVVDMKGAQDVLGDVGPECPQQ